jgi:hypothetical protein
MDTTPPSDLAADLQTRGCAVCDHLAARASAFFAQWQYALYADERARSEYATGPGLCPLHLWQLEGISSLVGAAVAHAPLAERIARGLEGAAAPSQSRTTIGHLVPRADGCRVCRLLSEAETEYIERLAAFVGERDGQEHYARSQGLCLRHLARLVAALPEEQTVALVLRTAARQFDQLAEDMRSYVVKTETLRRELYTVDDLDAVQRAFTHLGGSRQVPVA